MEDVYAENYYIFKKIYSRPGIECKPQLWPTSKLWQHQILLTHCTGPGIKLTRPITVGRFLTHCIMLGTPENYIFMEETGNTNKWENIPYSKIGRIFSDKMSLLLKAFYKFSTIPIKIPNGIFHRNRTNKPKTCMEPQNIPKIQSNPEREKNQYWA